MRTQIASLVFLFAAAIALSAAEPSFSGRPSPVSKTNVVAVKNSNATRAFMARPEEIPPMLERGILELSGKKTVKEAWREFVSEQDVIGIKVYSLPGEQSGTRPAVVAAVVESLLSAGIPAERIIIWDRQLTSLRLAGFSELETRYKVRLAGALQQGFDDTVFYESSILGEPVWGDVEFGKKGEGIGRKSHLSRLLASEVTKIISISPMLNHNHAGVTGTLYSLAMGSMDNVLRFEFKAERLATAVPEIYGLPEIADRVVLNICDALICQYQGEQRSLVHYSTPLNELRFSRDAVALDVLSLQELDRQRALSGKPTAAKPNRELYENASLLELGLSDTNRITLKTIVLGE